MELLRTEGLKKKFGELAAVDEVDLSLQAGIITAIIGPNGAGKTTLINLLTGYLLPNAGKIYFKGEDITNLPADKRVRKRICRSFQITNIFPKLSVFQNVQLPVLSLFRRNSQFLSSVDGGKDCVEEVERILKEVGLWEERQMLAGELSHGDQRLLDLALAIAAKPELCFLDEPSSGMNPLERVKVLELIKRLSAERETTFVIIEHDMDVVFSLSDWIIVMNRGKIIAEGEPIQIQANKEVRDIYLGEEL